MTRAYIGIGSNIEPEKNVRAAIRLLAQRTCVRAVSTFYLTDPIGPAGAVGTARYVNGVVAIDTDLAPHELKYTVLRGIEEELGRKRSSDRYAPRAIDLDILLHGDSVINENGTTIPDLKISERAFLAIPLAELDPDLALPGTGARIGEITSRLGREGMTPLIEFTDMIRKEIVNGSQKS
jgi:dihydroneopterin aldolase/2-amino-4-hydroxy-6-hydroxymethyldihydropteridine diphosphokinase